jgi:RHS repeat-associated protein
MNNKRIEEKLHATGDSELYRYDSAYRLTRFERGALNATRDAIVVPSAHAPLHSQWRLDGVGNWPQVDGETRQHSSFNEITVRNNGAPSTLLSDNNGNMTDDGEFTFQWDYLNRLRTVTRKSGGTPIAVYSYDAVSRRIRKQVTNSGALNGTTDFYLDGWREIEERNGADALVQQYVYGVYIDEPLVLDRNLGGGDTAVGVGDQRLFYHQNTLASVFALTDSAGRTVEGYQYDAYGHQMVYTPGSNGVVDFGGDDVITSGGLSAVRNPYTYTGRRVDAETALYHFRQRYLNAEQGRFTQRDQSGYEADSWGNLYTYVSNMAPNLVDPSGLSHKYWVRQGKGKKVKMGVVSNGGECIQIQGKVPTPIGVFCPPIAVFGSLCVCELEVTWTCEVKEVEYQHIWYWFDKPTGQTRTTYYIYTETISKTANAKCESNADCTKICDEKAEEFRRSFGSVGGRFGGGWQGKTCDK